MDSNLDAIGAEEPEPSTDTSGSDTGEDATGGEDDAMDGFDFSEAPEKEPVPEEPTEEEPTEEHKEEKSEEEPKATEEPTEKPEDTK